MRTKTKVRAGETPQNHNTTRPSAGLKIKTRVRAGDVPHNHNATRPSAQR
jgi:hypothetical protein